VAATKEKVKRLNLRYFVDFLHGSKDRQAQTLKI